MIRPYYFYMDNPNNTAFETAKASGSLFMLANEGIGLSQDKKNRAIDLITMIDDELLGIK